MLITGDILDGKYQVIRHLGTGGMSVVYLCKNIRLENLWAIKEIKKEVRQQMDSLAEPTILKNLRHPGIPRIVDIFYENENLYIVEDYIEGKTLEDTVKSIGPMGVDRICEIVSGLCSIIEYLHGLNPPVIYRDLKPSNIMIASDGRVMLIDFGISRIYKNDREHDTVSFGSEGYAAPEQYGRAQSSRQTDIYGLGATMYFMATGEAPVHHAVNGDAFNALEGHKLKEIIKKAMQAETEDRYSSIEEVRKQVSMVYEETVKTNNIGIKNKIEKTKKMQFDAPSPKTKIVKSSIVKSPKHMGRIWKVLAGLLILVVVMLVGEYFMINHGRETEKASAKTPSTAGTVSENNETADKPKDTPVKVSHMEDTRIDGAIDLNKPLLLNNTSSGDYKSSSRGKAKGKSKSTYYENVQDDVFYEMSPKATNVKYDGKFTLNLMYAEQKGSDLIVYCTIGNSTGKVIGISKANTYIFSGEGRHVQADAVESTETSKTLLGSGSNDLAITFRNFNLDTKLLVMTSNTVSSETGYNNGEIRLAVNVKHE